MEMAHGTLKGLMDMVKRRGTPRLDVDLSRFFFQQIILTVKYCHEKGIIIRDLKPANLLVTWGPNGPSRLQLCDFGWAKIIPDLVRFFFNLQEFRLHVHAALCSFDLEFVCLCVLSTCCAAVQYQSIHCKVSDLERER